jgi:hypothetical protein
VGNCVRSAPRGASTLPARPERDGSEGLGQPFAAHWVKNVQFIGRVDPQILASKSIAMTVDGKAYKLEGDFLPNPTPQRAQTVLHWRAKGPGGWRASA